MNFNKLKYVDWKILIYVFILLIIGLFALYSASTSTDFDEFKKQIIWILAGFPILLFITIIDYKILARFSLLFYILAIIILIAVLFTQRINGARSWFVIGQTTIQPAEFTKIAVILFLASRISGMKKTKGSVVNNLRNLLEIIGIVLFPVVLIAIEPDYGTAMGYVFALIFILFVSGIDKKYIIASLIIVIIALPLLYFFVLPEHAKARIDVYLNPYTDPRGDGYNIIQSEIAIGAGQLLRTWIFKWNSNTFGLFISKNNRFYIFCNWGRIWIYNM